jgi:hypothetical protein
MAIAQMTALVTDALGPRPQGEHMASFAFLLGRLIPFLGHIAIRPEHIEGMMHPRLEPTLGTGRNHSQASMLALMDIQHEQAGLLFPLDGVEGGIAMRAGLEVLTMRNVHRIQREGSLYISG